jgi:SP family general alpha glucoside:H+ symporter-like MFS transporter
MDLSGTVLVLGYQFYYYQLIGYTPKKSFLLTMLNNCFQFLANILSLFLVTTVDRRLLTVWGQFVCGAALFFFGGTSLPGTYSGYLTTVCVMLVWGFVYQLTLGTVAWTLVAELASYRLRARTQWLANATLCLIQWTTGFCLPVHVQSGSGKLAGEGGLCVWGDDVYWVCGDVLFPAGDEESDGAGVGRTF